MTTVHSSGSYTEPIVVSDEEDAAFVENELSRWTDSSNSSSNTPTYNPYTSYLTPFESLPSPTLPKTPPPPPAPAYPPIELPVSGQKRKWTDMRDTGNTAQSHPPPETHGGNKKKKKQKKERQAQQRAAAAAATSKSQRNVPAIPPVDGANFVEFPGFPFLQSTFDPYYPYGMGYQMPMDTYQSSSSSFVSPEDEYRPTDGLLWNPLERPFTLSALAPPWYPPNASYSNPESHSEPSSALFPQETHPPTPPSDSPIAQPSASIPALPVEQSTSSSSSGPPPLDLSSILNQPFDSSLSERLKQLEAISASLLALANGQRSIQHVPSPDPIHLPSADPPPIRREPPPPRNAPEAAPARPQGESQKRLMGVTKDKGNNGYFDLTTPHLEPPAPAAPIPPVADFTLVMAHLPKKFRKTDFVMSWAKRHGNPVRVVLDPKFGKALVEWVGAHSVDSAFTSMRLRGDGKEHIRVYHYRGVKRSPISPPVPQVATKVEKEIEEGEIEEGEVVEVVGKSKQKRNKGKKKMVELEQRLTEPSPSNIAPPAEARALPPHFPGLGHIDLAAVLSAVSRVPVIPTPAPAPSDSRPQLIDRFTDPPAHVATREGVEEEEMELESDEDGERPPPSPHVPQPIATVHSTESGDYQEEDMDLDEDDEEGAMDADVEEDEVEDMDMDMSSPSPIPTSAALPLFKVHPAPRVRLSSSSPRDTSDHPQHESAVEVGATSPTTLTLETAEQVEVDAAKEARRHKLEEAIARTKAELAMRALATSTRTSLVSSTGSSESPEPITPVDSPVVGHVEVAFASAPQNAVAVLTHKETTVEEKTAVVVKTEDVALDDLAASFISETIHAAANSSTPLSTSATTVRMSASTQVAAASVAPLRVSVPAPKTTTPVMIPLSEEQKQLMQKKWFELVTTSKSLFGKFAAAKTKEEKDLLMRLLRAKTKAADDLKREIDSGVVIIAAIASSAESSVPASASTVSATPTPVPSSRLSSATPTPSGTSTPTGMVPHKRKTSPSVGPQVSRWPETAREMIIIVSDDEESDYEL